MEIVKSNGVSQHLFIKTRSKTFYEFSFQFQESVAYWLFELLAKHDCIIHRELKLDGAFKVKGKFVTSSEMKNFQNPSCPILEKVNENYDKK